MLLNILVTIGINKYISKLLVELFLFILSFIVQKNIIFNEKFNIKNNFEKLYSIFIVLLTIYFIFDTFVISSSYQKVKNIKHEINSTNETIITNDTYEDNNIKINIKTYYEYETQIYLVNIFINDPSYLKTAFAKDTFGKNITETTSEMAKRNNAIIAINGDYYGVQEKGYVLRNGVIYRNKSKNNKDLAIYKDGTFELFREGNTSLEDLYNKGAYNVFAFGPGLIDNYEIIVSEKSKVRKEQNSNPRTAIGYIDSNHYVFVVSDGRSKESKGLSLYELATFLNKFNIKTAYNLDGGGSSTLYFNGNIINKPSSKGERSISDIIYVGY